MTRAATDPILTRVRKLLALANSPEPNEAASAAASANDLMRRHGITADDVAEDALEVADEVRDPDRDELAHLVARWCGVSMVANRHGAIGFQGRPAAAKRAREVYRKLVNTAEYGSEMSREGGPPEAARQVWRICWWLGFRAALGARMLPPAQKMPSEYVAILASRASAPVAVRDALRAMDDLAYELEGTVDDVQAVLGRLREKAFAAGNAAGERIALDEAPRMLRSR